MEEKQSYHLQRTNKLIYHLLEAFTRSGLEPHSTGLQRYSFASPDYSICIIVPEDRRKALPILSILFLFITENRGIENSFFLPSGYVVDIRELKNSRKAKQSIEEAMEYLSYVQITETAKEANISGRLVSRWEWFGYKKQMLHITIPEPVFNRLNAGRNAAPVYLPLLQVNMKRMPNAMSIGMYLLMMKNIQTGKGGKHEDSFSVMKLLNHSWLFPNRESRVDLIRYSKQRIIIPFEESMDALVQIGMLSGWKYTQTGAQRCPEYSEFIAASISVSWNCYPKIRKNMHENSDPKKSRFRP